MKRKIAIPGFLTALIFAVIAVMPTMTSATTVRHPAAQDGVTAKLIAMSHQPGQWVMPTQNYANTRFSPLKQINTSNVKNLKAAWTFSLGTLRGQEGQPLVVGHMMYVLSNFPNYLYAIDLRNIGRIKWRWVIPQQSQAAQKEITAQQAVQVACCDVVTRGPAYAPGTAGAPPKIIVYTLDTHVAAINANTGKTVWTALNGDPKLGQTGTMAPLVVNNKVIVGISGGEYGVRGHVTAYDLNTGRRLWRAYSMGPDSDTLMGADFLGPHNQGVSTWSGNQWKLGGGTTWGWYSYDPKLNLFYYSTGNPGTWNPTIRPGDNKWSMSIIARNPDTGQARWAYQMTPHDQWDYDGINENILVTLPVNGVMTPALVHFDRNGYAYVLDRRNGKLLAAHPYDPSVNTIIRVDMTTGRPVYDPKYETREGHNTTGLSPASIGAKDEAPAAWDPQTHLFYVPTNHACEDYQPVPAKYFPGFPYVGAIVRMYPGPGGYLGAFIGYDPLTGRYQFRDSEPFAAWGGAVTTAGGLAFYGTMDGWLKAVDVHTGKLLWKFKCPSGIIGNPMTYSGPDNKQYVAVLSGVGGWSGIGVAADMGLEDPTAGLGAIGAFKDLASFSNQGGVLTVFALPWGSSGWPPGRCRPSRPHRSGRLRTACRQAPCRSSRFR